MSMTPSQSNHSPKPDRLITLPRAVTLLASLLAALAAGTNYVYSAYAPQLGNRLGINHTQLNIIGLGGNIGVYVSGPIWGRLVDSRGPRLPLICGSIFLFSGYFGLRLIYDRGVPDSAELTTRAISFLTRADPDKEPTKIEPERISTLFFWLLVVCSLITGAGGNGGLTASVNSTAKSFPDRARATMTGIVISGFGLSAFLFASISHLVFPGDTSSFLLLLAIGTAIPMIIGFFLIRPVPLPASELLRVHSTRRRSESAERTLEDLEVEAAGVGVAPGVFATGSEIERLLDDEDEERVESAFRSAHDLEMDVSPPRPRSALPGTARSTRSFMNTSGHYHLNVHGKALFKSTDFWILCFILSLLSGTGLMFINNVGSIAHALYASETTHYDEKEAGKWQAMQVSAISIMNFTSRIAIGIVADFTKNKLHLPRSYNLTLVSTLFIAAQLLAITVDKVEDLWKVSMMLGFSYGCVFALLPMLCIEWFGMPHFSENWGYISLSPMVGGNIFSIAFGRNLDRHAGEEDTHTAVARAFLARDLPNDAQCLKGKECYVDTLYLTIFASVVALGLSVWAGWRDRKREREAERE